MYGLKPCLPPPGETWTCVIFLPLPVLPIWIIWAPDDDLVELRTVTSYPWFRRTSAISSQLLPLKLLKLPVILSFVTLPFSKISSIPSSTTSSLTLVFLVMSILLNILFVTRLLIKFVANLSKLSFSSFTNALAANLKVVLLIH